MTTDHDHTEPPPDIELRVKALESLLVDKGLVIPDTLNTIIDTYEHRIGPRNGAHVIAKAWAEPEFKKALMDNATEAVAKLGYLGRQGEHLQVVENTIDVHNLVVCTLCSCYPWTVLGLPPVWYKSAPYRSRAVSNPRSVLTEFGTKLDLGVKIRVWDSTSETEGWTIEQLGELVTRNSMIGVEQVKVPDGNS